MFWQYQLLQQREAYGAILLEAVLAWSRAFDLNF